jgi:hypothetical protein
VIGNASNGVFGSGWFALYLLFSWLFGLVGTISALLQPRTAYESIGRSKLRWVLIELVGLVLALGLFTWIAFRVSVRDDLKDEEMKREKARIRSEDQARLQLKLENLANPAFREKFLAEQKQAEGVRERAAERKRSTDELRGRNKASVSETASRQESTRNKDWIYEPPESPKAKRKCTTCNGMFGPGKVQCYGCSGCGTRETFHEGIGYTHDLCGQCYGNRFIPCGSCDGSGEVL